MSFKIGDKVKAVRARLDHKAKHIGQTFTIREINPNGAMFAETHYGVVERNECIYIWFNDELKLVEEKKVFTAKDLKTGMFGYFDNETDDWFVIAGDRFIYQKGCGDDVSKLNDNLEMPSGRKITALYEGKGFYHAKRPSNTPIWKREKEKPLYNGKVVCVDATLNEFYTVGKIYQFKDGQLTADHGRQYPKDNINPAKNIAKIHNFEEWSNWSTAKWIEIKE